jgi:bifunctional ADP-heptose synthase (sugar kinase/adenylyltransferase)
LVSSTSWITYGKAGEFIGEGRPEQNQQARAEMLAALEAVDLVVLFEQDTPLGLIGRRQA